MSSLCTLDEILRVEHLKKYFVKKGILDSRRITVRAADDVSFSIRRGETFVLAGESGSGKSTIAKMILKSIEPDSGKIFFEGREVTGSSSGLEKIRMGCQMIHQDPYDSINPRMRIGDIVSEPLEIHGMGGREYRKKRVLEVLKEVKLEPADEIVRKYPHMLSGGQRQRVTLARALAQSPKIILADEPVSMLDVSIRAEMLELMQNIQQKYEITFIYITHDLATARYFGQRIGVLYMGKIVEIGRTDDVLLNPRHPYTMALVNAIPDPDPANLSRRRVVMTRDLTNASVMSGCRFQDRCMYVIEKCGTEPGLEEKASGHSAACHVNLT